MRKDRFVLFKGRRFLLTAGGAMTTPEDYAAFLPTFAHVDTHGFIMQFGKAIGTRDDLTDDGPADCEPPSLMAIGKNITHPGWRRA